MAMAAPLKVCLTGGTSGIGLQVLKDFVKSGHEVTILTRNSSRTSSALSLIPSASHHLVKPVECRDLADLTAVRNAAREVSSALPHLDVLVLNAGILQTKLEVAQGKSSWYIHFKDAFNVYLLTKAASGQQHDSYCITT
jgi:NAD(P)-dependent dehydrogenase (short-subunit alcohol dehydrogenase family)